MLLEASCRRITPLRNTLSSPLWTPPNWFDENMFHSSSKAAHCQSQSHCLQKLPDAQLLRRLLIASCCHIRTITPYNNKGCKRDVCSSTNYERAHQHAIANHGLAHSRLLQQPIVSKDDCGKRFGRKNGFSNITYAGLHLILGPMFAGKTTALLQRIQAEADAGRNVALVKSDKDTRYGLNAVVSHDGIQMSCMAVPDLATFKEKLGKFYYEVEVIGIDEAQFFKDLIEFCKAAADNDGKTVIVAGLDGDFLRRKFGSAVDLIPLADSVTKLSSRCELCGQPAAFTFRKTEDLEKEVIGGADVYMPVCRRHYISEQVALNSSMVDNELHTVVS